MALTGSFRSSFRPPVFTALVIPATRISRYLGRFLFVTVATICVSENPSEMTNVAISIGRKTLRLNARVSRSVVITTLPLNINILLLGYDRIFPYP